MASLIEQFDALKAQVASDAVKLEEGAKALADMTAARDALATQVETLTAQVAEGVKAVEAAKADGAKALEAEQSAHAATKAELVTAKAALANPAFAQAAIGGKAEATHEGGAAIASAKMSKAEALVEYRKLTDDKAKADFRREHAEELGLK